MAPISSLQRLQSVKEIGYGKAWSLMEDVLKEGKTRSIGVSNYMIDEMTEMLETAKVSQIIR
jgi:diketogulonate reductase-like aldo/keto reductase